jgi:hypothetical protein
VDGGGGVVSVIITHLTKSSGNQYNVSPPFFFTSQTYTNKYNPRKRTQYFTPSRSLRQKLKKAYETWQLVCMWCVFIVHACPCNPREVCILDVNLV